MIRELSRKKFTVKHIFLLDSFYDQLIMDGRKLRAIKTMKKRKLKYINNTDFNNAMKKYRSDYQKAEKDGTRLPSIPNYIGECFLKISSNLARKPNFANYPFRDEMEADGLENAVRAINNFDPDKSDNPFAYFTTVIYYAFLRRIDREKKELYCKHKALERATVNGDMYEGEADMNTKNNDLDTDYMNNFVRDFEDKMRRKSEKAKKKKEDDDVTSNN